MEKVQSDLEKFFEISKESNKQIKIVTRADNTFSNYIEVKDAVDIDTKIKGKFFLIKYEYDNNREDDFIEFVLNNIENYALTDEEKKKIKSAREIIRRAYRRFVKNSKTGEFGEMILFFILEVFENAMQIVNKMALKTSGNVHYHGADSIHFGINEELKILYLGESKTIEAFTDALSDSIRSVEGFYNTEKNLFEVDLISGNLSKSLSPEIKAVIENYLDPTQIEKTDCCQIHAIFLGFEESFLKVLEKDHSGEDLIKRVTEQYKEKITEYVRLIEGKIKGSEVSDKRFYFFLLPFKDLKRTREKFSNEVKNV